MNPPSHFIPSRGLKEELETLVSLLQAYSFVLLGKSGENFFSPAAAHQILSFLPEIPGNGPAKDRLLDW
jgi:hypothetical protein